MHCAADDSAQRGATGGCARCAATRALASDFQCSMPAVRPVSRAGDCAADGVPGVAGYINAALCNSIQSLCIDPFSTLARCVLRFRIIAFNLAGGPGHYSGWPGSGLDDAEEQAAIKRGFIAIHLGPRILRTETAGLAMLAALAARWKGWHQPSARKNPCSGGA